MAVTRLIGEIGQVLEGCFGFCQTPAHQHGATCVVFHKAEDGGQQALPPPRAGCMVITPLALWNFAVLSKDDLREQLPRTAECLAARSAHLIDEDLISAYVDLDWLEWQGGGLRLTVTGQNLCAQVTREHSADKPQVQGAKPRRRAKAAPRTPSKVPSAG